ncbi:biotin--[acetyl-CoA-carboxylase] ligase, partial [Thermodesulfobacteriota bacterium]
NWNPGEQEGMLYPTTSILSESGCMVSRNELLAGILLTFEGYYQEILSGRTEDLHRKWNELSLVMGKEVAVESENKTVKGKAIRIDHEGALVILDKRGREYRILSGDVSVKY